MYGKKNYNVHNGFYTRLHQSKLYIICSRSDKNDDGHAHSIIFFTLFLIFTCAITSIKADYTCEQGGKTNNNRPRIYVFLLVLVIHRNYVVQKDLESSQKFRNLIFFGMHICTVSKIRKKYVAFNRMEYFKRYIVH